MSTSSTDLLQFHITDVALWLQDCTTPTDEPSDQVYVEFLYEQFSTKFPNYVPFMTVRNFKSLVVKTLHTTSQRVKRNGESSYIIKNYMYKYVAQTLTIEDIEKQFAVKHTVDGRELVHLYHNNTPLRVKVSKENVVTAVFVGARELHLDPFSETSLEFNLRRLLHSKPCARLVAERCVILKSVFLSSDEVKCEPCADNNRKRILRDVTNIEQVELSAVNFGRESLQSELLAVSQPLAEHLSSQLETASKRKRVYDSSTIVFALRQSIHSPKGYEELRRSQKMGILPCSRTLKKYKNAIKHDPGINVKVLDWMDKVFQERGATAFERIGGLLFDETTIQADISFDEERRIYGYAQPSKLRNEAESIFGKHQHPVMANKVFQLVFSSLDGVTFPFGHWPVTDWNFLDIMSTVYEAVELLYQKNFIVKYVSMDGASANRKAVQRMLKASEVNPPNTSYSVYNIDKSGCITFIMDIKHSFKKLRNSVLSSKKSSNAARRGKKKLNRQLQNSKGCIFWEHWQNAYEFSKQRQWSIHPKLTKDHIYDIDKMRNHLAEEVLNKHMLYLMKEYQTTTTEDLSASIELLEVVSPLIDIFTDRIHGIGVEDMSHITKAVEYFDSWRQYTTEKSKLPTTECLWDMKCSLTGLIELTRLNPDIVIRPGLVNSDLVELHFSQVRELFHNHTPNAYQYANVQNSIILGQPLAGRNKKSNAGCSYPAPYNFYLKGKEKSKT